MMIIFYQTKKLLVGPALIYTSAPKSKIMSGGQLLGEVS